MKKKNNCEMCSIDKNDLDMPMKHIGLIRDNDVIWRYICYSCWKKIYKLMCGIGVKNDE